ncbi:glycoside hydrolase family protein [Ochrovirga pacifica]|uniref:hypothetical protein n=1 Tax=Ochrovirga pacifica TaxID=1042376 RepID=UPI00025591B9|nr:hypothetical protein [Ochrovirga pacifica]
MKTILRLAFVVLTFFSCSANSNPIEKQSDKETEETTKHSQTKVNPGNVSDSSMYPATPYSQDGAGYQGKDFKELPQNRMLTFTAGENDTDRLNQLITDLNQKGGGTILIKKGAYTIKDVCLKSNIHITIEQGTTFTMDHDKWHKGIKNFLFNIGMKEGKSLVQNVKITGLGTINSRPKCILTRPKNTFYRAIAIGYVKNVLIQNLTIQDHLTKGAAIAFNPVKVSNQHANIAQNVTIANIELTGGSIGYGLAQTNVGKNILLKNLVSHGGMTCRIEAHTGRQYNLGVSNIVIKNVASIHGKAAVLLQPHSVVNGRILVDGAKSQGSTWTLFLRRGFVAKDSKRKARGSFSQNSQFKNISLAATDHTATLSYKNFVYVPKALHPLYKNPDFNPVLNDANYTLVDGGGYGKESAVLGASVAVVFTDADYPMQLPTENQLVLTGKTEGRIKIMDKK